MIVRNHSNIFISLIIWQTCLNPHMDHCSRSLGSAAAWADLWVPRRDIAFHSLQSINFLHVLSLFSLLWLGSEPCWYWLTMHYDFKKSLNHLFSLNILQTCLNPMDHWSRSLGCAAPWADLWVHRWDNAIHRLQSLLHVLSLFDLEIIILVKPRLSDKKWQAKNG